MRGEGEKARILRAPRKTGRNKNTKEVRKKAVETAQGQNRIREANRKRKGKKKKQGKATLSQEEYIGEGANRREVGRGNSTVPKSWVIR